MVKKREIVNLPCGGIASFCKFPICTNLEKINSNIAVIGIPWDSGTGYRPGSRLGPRTIREYSVRYSFRERGVKQGGYWDLDENKRFLEKITFCDCGDVDVLYLDVNETFERITEDITTILSNGVFPVVLGGDHSITFPVVRAYEGINSELNLIHFDAHLDYTDSVLGVKLASGSPIKRCSELGFIKEIVTFGVRGLRTIEGAYRDSLKRNNKIISANQILFGEKEDIFSKIPSGKAYVTIDIDVLDPSIAPGTCSPEFGGINYLHLKLLLKEVANKCDVIGMDMVEVNPSFDDNSGSTALIATQTILEFLGVIFDKKE